ncbi:MAG: tetratricopeptide repeat protein [Acidobacteria bacterium]|nr:tetratricopeptide repeat protein [Acidobacteriota bacterium]
MKRCPECRRDYYDDTLLYCLDDGNALLEGPARSEPGAIATGFPSDEPQTAILHSTAAPGEAPTRAQIHTTEQTAVFPRGAEAKPQESLDGVSEKPSFSANRAAKPLIAVVVAFVLLVGGFLGYRYFNISGSAAINSIAVMPFVNDSGNADIDYLSDGMTESLISNLTEIPNLSVKARSTVFYFKGKEKSVKELGEELGVEAVLLGRVSQRGEDLKVTLELVDTKKLDAIWSQTYNRKMNDLVSLQSEIAKTVSDKLRSKLTATEQERVSKTNTTSSEAQQLYLKGRFHWNKRKTEDFQKAREYFQQAIAADPKYALAYAGLADTLALMPYYGAFRPSEYMPLAKQAAQKALEIDPNLAEAHASLGQILTNYDYDLKGAERELKRAIELNPKYPSAYQWLAEVYHFSGNGDQALSEINKAIELDPLSMVINNQKGRVNDFGGKRDEAIAQFKKTIELFPDAPSPRNNLADVYEAKGMYSEAVEQRLIQIKLLFGVSPENIKDLQLAFEKDGYKGFVQKQIDIQLDSQRSSLEKDKNAYLPAFRIAETYARLQDKDKAFEYLNKSYDQREPQIAELKIRLPFVFLRDDQRFKELVKKVGIPE